MAKVLKQEVDTVFDNMWCKPPQQGAEFNAKHSVGVMFQADSYASGFQGGTYYGQYNFETCKWTPVPDLVKVDNPKFNGFEDRFVSYWWHHPSFKSLCEKSLTDGHGNLSLRNISCGEI